jgi:magnesium chelatase family protein
VVLFGLDGFVVDVAATVTASRSATHRGAWAEEGGWREAKERVRAAVSNSDHFWPDEFVTFAVSPPAASRGVAGCDLALACTVLAAAGRVPADRLADTVLLGELGLDGGVRPTRGVLPALLTARREGLRRAVVPASALPEAALVSDMEVLGAARLDDVLGWLRGERGRLTTAGSPPPGPQPPVPDLADVIGQPQARWALEVAAAGGHPLLLLGPAGSGKSLVARRLPGLLPRLSGDQALETTAIHSVAGGLNAESPLITLPPFIEPHHSTSVPAFVGGGAGAPKPGALSKAHNGVLFLDQVTEFGPSRLDAVCTALDDGEIRLARRDGVARYPARFGLVLAAALCPCDAPHDQQCSCSPHARRRHLTRLADRLFDRVDLRVRLDPVAARPSARRGEVENTTTVRARVEPARRRAIARWGTTNAHVPGSVLRGEFAVPHAVTESLDRAVLTARAADACLRVAWTLADLVGVDCPGADQIAEALALRDRGFSAVRVVRGLRPGGPQ